MARKKQPEIAATVNDAVQNSALYIERETRKVPRPMSDEQIASLLNELKPAFRLVAAREDWFEQATQERKEAKEALEEAEKAVHEINRRLCLKIVEVDVTVEAVYDYAAGEVIIRDAESGEEYERREMTMPERQGKLGLQVPEGEDPDTSPPRTVMDDDEDSGPPEGEDAE